MWVVLGTSRSEDDDTVGGAAEKGRKGECHTGAREGERSTRCSSAYVAAKVAGLANTAWSTLVKVIRAVIVQH